MDVKGGGRSVEATARRSLTVGTDHVVGSIPNFV